ncbi:MAG: Beta-hexosaminidase [Ignavibacteria bacterium]|nr:Beta-hexosaminidase [Ignavibacteria bacterium]
MQKLLSLNVFLLALSALIFSDYKSVFKTFSIKENQSVIRKYSPQENSGIRQKLTSMTLREKIAQMIITNSFGYSLNENSEDYLRLKNLIVNEKIGGVIFFKGNSIQQAELTNKLQSLSEIPLLISADYERGTRMRLDDGSLFPNNMALGATRNPELAYKMGLMIAKECKAIGVHQNYAPVLDINNNSLNPIINVRSFGEDPELVSSMGLSFIKGLQDGKIIATAKHFPGHGDTDIDSHSDLPVLNFSKERLESLELVPFKNAVNAGVKSVMIAHLSIPVYEKNKNMPASLSANIVDQLLINEMKFNGLIVTDALNMSGVLKHFSTDEIALNCIYAGIDLILMPTTSNNKQGEVEFINAIENAVNNGQISEDRINKSVKKILDAKDWLNLEQNKYVDADKVSGIINSPEAADLSQKIADESVTLVKNNDNIIPFSNSQNQRCLIVSLNNGNEKANSDYFLQKFSDKNKFSEVSYYDLTGDVANVDEIISDSRNYDVIIIPIYAKVKIKTGTVGLPQTQIELINSLADNGKKTAVVSFGNPYLIQGFNRVDAYICAYADAETSINSVIDSFYGTIKFKGKLPVTINNEFKYGDGITNN